MRFHQLEYYDRSTVKRTAPCLLQNLVQIKLLRVSCERYYSLEVDLSNFPSHRSNFTLFVKKRCGYLSFLEDPDSLRTLQIQTGISKQSSFVDLIESFIQETHLSPFVKYLCSHVKNVYCNSFSHDFEGFCLNGLYHCLLFQMPGFLNWYLYMYLDRVIRKRSEPLLSVDSWDLRLIRGFVHGHRYSSGGLVSSDILATLNEVVERMCLPQRE